MSSLLTRIFTWAFIASACLPSTPEAVEQQPEYKPGTVSPTGRTAAQAKGSPVEGSAVLMDRAAGASRKQLQAQYEALRQIDDLRMTYDARGIPRNIFGRTPFKIPKDIQSPSGRAALESVIEQIRPMLLSEGTETLTLAREPDVLMHLRSIQLLESIRGIPVRDGAIVLTVNDRKGHVSMISASFLPDRGLEREPKLTADDAVRAAKDYLQKEADLRASRPAQRDIDRSIPDPPEVVAGSSAGFVLKSPPELGYRIGQVATEEQPARLVWAIHFEAPATILMVIEVDAIDGSIVGAQATPTLSRTVHDSAGYSMWGPVARTEGQPPVADAPVNLLYDHVGWALSALDLIGPTGLASAPFDLAVRNTTYGAHNGGASRRYQATWIYEARFGPGIPGGVYVPDTHVGNALDVIGHELSHHVAMIKNTLQCSDDYSCGFTGMGLNEGFADVAGIATDMSFSRPSPWFIGEDAFGSGLAYRDAAAPILMNLASRDFWAERSMARASEGASHLNATIVSHAYYLLVNGGYHYRAGIGSIPSILVPALGREKSERIFYGTLLLGGLGQTATFQEAKTQTRNRALDLYDQAEQDATTLAWDAVGVGSCTTVPSVPTLQAVDICPWWRLSLFAVAGATTYHSQYSLYPSYSPAYTWQDGPGASECEIYPSNFTYFRARACNACGCSAWSPNALVYPWQGECP